MSIGAISNFTSLLQPFDFNGTTAAQSNSSNSSSPGGVSSSQSPEDTFVSLFQQFQQTAGAAPQTAGSSQTDALNRLFSQLQKAFSNGQTPSPPDLAKAEVPRHHHYRHGWDQTVPSAYTNGQIPHDPVSAQPVTAVSPVSTASEAQAAT